MDTYPYGSAREKDTARMEQLNAAFGKRTAVLDDYHETMILIRAGLKMASDELNLAMRTLIILHDEANRQGRTPAKTTLEQIKAKQDQARTQRALMEQFREQMDAAVKKRIQDISDIDDEIAALGGSLGLRTADAS